MKVTTIVIVATLAVAAHAQVAPTKQNLERVWSLTADPNEGIRDLAWSAIAASGCDGFYIAAEQGTADSKAQNLLFENWPQVFECDKFSPLTWSALLSMLKTRTVVEFYWNREDLRRMKFSPAAATRAQRFARMMDELGSKEPLRSQLAVHRKEFGQPRNTPVTVGASIGIPSAAMTAPPSIMMPATLMSQARTDQPSYDRFAPFRDNAFHRVKDQPLSTLSTDVDGSSYTWVRGSLTIGELPTADAIRVEEMVNYFPYSYPTPSTAPVALGVEVSECPWNPAHRLAKIALKAKEMEASKRGPTNLVYLIDTSGSMNDVDRLPLLQEALRRLTGRLTAQDRIAIVSYAGSERLVLDSTAGDQKEAILRAINDLKSAGATNGAGGLMLAYNLARKNFIPGGVNRIILGTDGDFNVGLSGTGELTKLVETEAKKGISITVLGFGRGNYRDEMAQAIAQNGDGNAYFIDSIAEADRVLGQQLAATLNIVAKDVKVQVEFNPNVVGAYRLVGYETRKLESSDFKNDAKDAGDLGAGHTVTVFYELIPAKAAEVASVPDVDPLKYQETKKATNRKETMYVKIRYKEPTGGPSQQLEIPVVDSGTKLATATTDFRFASAVTIFGMALRNGETDKVSLAVSRQLAENSLDHDPGGYRSEFLGLIKLAEKIKFLNAVLSTRR